MSKPSMKFTERALEKRGTFHSKIASIAQIIRMQSSFEVERLKICQNAHHQAPPITQS